MTSSANSGAVMVVRSLVEIRNLMVIADIGVRHHEMGRPQELLVSVALEVIPPGTDLIDDTVDYTAIAALADALGRERIGLIETYAARLARACLDDQRVLQATVTVDKPRALEAGMASTTLTLRRQPSRDQD